MKLLVDQLPTNPHQYPFYKARSKSKHITYPHCRIDGLVCCPSTCQHLLVMANNMNNNKNQIGFLAPDNKVDREDLIVLLAGYANLHTETMNINKKDDEVSIYENKLILHLMSKYNIQMHDLKSRSIVSILKHYEIYKDDEKELDEERVK